MTQGALGAAGVRGVWAGAGLQRACSYKNTKYLQVTLFIELFTQVDHIPIIRHIRFDNYAA